MDSTAVLILLASVSAGVALLGLVFAVLRALTSRSKQPDISSTVTSATDTGAATKGSHSPAATTGGMAAARDIVINQSGMTGEERERFERVEEYIEELKKGSAAPPEGSVPLETSVLAAQATDKTESLLAEAIELQRENKEREAIEKLLTAYDADMPALAKSQLHLLAGSGYLRLSDYGAAEYHYRTSSVAGHAAASKSAEGNALGGLGLVYRRQGDLLKAEDHHLRALTIHREIDYQLGEASELGNLGIIYQDRGDLPKAEDHHLQALAISREIGNQLCEANALGGLGNVYIAQGELERAEDHYRQALVTFGTIGNRLGEANTLGNLGSVDSLQGNIVKAEEHHQQALVIDREIGNRSGEAEDLGNLGLLAATGDDRDEACQRLNEALSIYNELGAGGQGPDLVRAKLEELGCKEEAEGGSRTEDAPTG